MGFASADLLAQLVPDEPHGFCARVLEGSKRRCGFHRRRRLSVLADYSLVAGEAALTEPALDGGERRRV